MRSASISQILEPRPQGLISSVIYINHHIKRQFTKFTNFKVKKINTRQSPSMQTNLIDGQKTERNLIAYSSSSLFLLDLAAM